MGHSGPAEYQPIPLSDHPSPNYENRPLPGHGVPGSALSRRRLLPYIVGAIIVLSVVNLSFTQQVQNLSHKIKEIVTKHPLVWNGVEEGKIEGKGGQSIDLYSGALRTAAGASLTSTPVPSKPLTHNQSGGKKRPKNGSEKHKDPIGVAKGGKTKPGSRPSPPDLPNPYLYGNYLDHLKPASEERYVTGIPLGGVNNQNKGVLSLLWLAKITHRTPILPPIIPNLHQRSLVRGPSYSTFYNLSRASSELGFPILEWNNIRPDTPHSYKGIEWLKNRWVEASNPLPCWVTSKMGGPVEDGGRGLAMPFGKGLLLDVKGIYAPGDETKGAWKEMNVAASLLNTNSSGVLVSGTKVEKDLGCLTQSYWLKERNEVLHQMKMLEVMRFTDELETLVDSVIATTLNTTPAKVRSGEARFITVHIRRGDVAQKCEPAPPNWEALRDIEIGNARRVEVAPVSQLPASLPYQNEHDEHLETQVSTSRPRKSKRKQPWQNCHLTDSFILWKIDQVVSSLPGPAPSVLLTTDDKSKESLALWDSTPGIFRVKHPDIGRERVGGEFWDVMVDAAILTRGEAFLGTAVSTMSRLAAERGKRWYGRPDSTF